MPRLGSGGTDDQELISQGKAPSAPDVRKGADLGWPPNNQEPLFPPSGPTGHQGRVFPSTRFIPTAEGRVLLPSRVICPNNSGGTHAFF